MICMYAVVKILCVQNTGHSHFGSLDVYYFLDHLHFAHRMTFYQNYHAKHLKSACEHQVHEYKLLVYQTQSQAQERVTSKILEQALFSTDNTNIKLGMVSLIITDQKMCYLYLLFEKKEISIFFNERVSIIMAYV